jgi:hypothetical protein
MLSRSLLLVVVSLLFACPALAQFRQGDNLSDAAARLSRDAEDFASASYNSYSNSNRNGRNDTEAMMLAQQFSAAARTFYRMTVDRRRNQDLRDAYDVMRNLASSVERSNVERSSWYNVQRSLDEVARAVNYGNNNPGPLPPDTGGGGGRSGRMTWKGRVDDDVRITIRGGSADVETIGGTPYYDGQPNFTASLPSRRVNVRLVNKRGRGEIYIEQQPSRENDFAVVVRIKDPKGGASDYEFELAW